MSDDGTEGWRRVDAYFAETLLPDDEALEAARRDSAGAGLPSIEVSGTHGKLLHILARSIGARHVLEVGTLGGYSTIWLARALPDGGRVVSLELDPDHAEVARANIARAGLSERVDIVVGPAAETLASHSGTAFDLAFIDADKGNNPRYVTEALRLCRPGALIVVDNVVRGGRVTDASSEYESVRGTREMLALLAREPRLEATAIQTVGTKGWDGFVIAVVAQ